MAQPLKTDLRGAPVTFSLVRNLLCDPFLSAASLQITVAILDFPSPLLSPPSVPLVESKPYRSLRVKNPSLPRRVGGRSPNRRLPGSYRHQTSLFHRIFLAAPVDAIGGEARQPHRDKDGISQRHQPKFAPHDVVSHAPNTDRPCHSQAQYQISDQVRSGNPRRWRNQRGKQRPRQSMRENQSREGERAAKPYRPQPADLVLPEATRGLRRVHRPHRFPGKQNPAARIGDAMAKLVIVGMHVRDRGKTANSCDPFPRRDNRSAETERNPFRPIRHQHTGKEIARRANGLQLSAEVFLRNAPIKGSHCADSFVRQGRNNLSQVGGTDAYVAVGQDQKFVPRLTGQPRLHIDLAIRPDSLRAYEKADPPLRKLRDEPLNQRHRGIRTVAHTEKNFVFRILLRTEARKILVRAKINSAHWLEQANRWSIGSELPSPLAKKKSQSRKRCQDVIGKRRGGDNEHEKTPARRGKSNNRNKKRAHLIPRALRSCPANLGVCSSPAGSNRRSLTRYFKPRQLILSVKNPANHTAALTASRTGASHSFGATVRSRSPHTPAE